MVSFHASISAIFSPNKKGKRCNRWGTSIRTSCGPSTSRSNHLPILAAPNRTAADSSDDNSDFASRPAVIDTNEWKVISLSPAKPLASGAMKPKAESDMPKASSWRIPNVSTMDLFRSCPNAVSRALWLATALDNVCQDHGRKPCHGGSVHNPGISSSLTVKLRSAWLARSPRRLRSKSTWSNWLKTTTTAQSEYMRASRPIPSGVLCSVVDMKEITIDYQDVVLVEQTLLRSARVADANCLSTAQQLVHGVAHVVGARCGLKLVILRRDLLDSFNALRSKSTIVVAYENRTGHFDEPLDI